MNEYLNKLYELYFCAVHTHWNYTGANFDAIHGYASEIAGLALEAIDDMVELCKARNINTTIKVEKTFYNASDKRAAHSLHQKAMEVYHHMDSVSKTAEQFGYADIMNVVGDQSTKLGKYVYKLGQTLE